jgi:hypothetical protein
LFFRKKILFLGLNLTAMEDSNLAIHDSKTMDETTKKEMARKRTARGFSLIAIGAISLLLGCVTTLVLPHSNIAYNLILYGLTSVGASVVFYGLYCVLE